MKSFTAKSWTQEKKVATVLLGILLLCLFATYILSIFHSYCNADAGYYIGVTELIHKGYVPYRDFQTSYTPLFFYVMQLPRFLMGSHYSYGGYLAFLYLVAFADAFLLGCIVRRIGASKILSLFVGLSFAALYYYLEGAYCILEGMTVLFGLLSILLLLTGKRAFIILLAGICSGLSFLTKQYGLVFCAVGGVFLLCSDLKWNRKLLQCVVWGVGFFVPILLMVVLFALSGLSINDLVNSLSGSDYGSQTSVSLLDGFVRLLKLFPFILLLPVLIFKKNNNTRAIAAACTIGLLLSMFQFFFNDFAHYYIIVVPFVMILTVQVWNNLKKGSPLFYIFLVIVSAAGATVLQTDYKQAKAMIKHNLREEQLSTSEMYEQVVAQYKIKNCLCYMQTMPLYALSPIEPSAMKEYAFSFGQDTDESMTERLIDAESVVISHQNLSSMDFPNFKNLLESDFTLVRQSKEANIYINNSKLERGL